MELSEIGSESSVQTILVESSDKWDLYIQYKSLDQGWASLTETQGKGTTGAVRLTLQENTTGKARKLQLVATSDQCTSSWNLTQAAHPSIPSRLPSSYQEDHVGNWMELPAVSNADGLYFFSHRHQTNRGESRDWSFYWDTEHLVAHWVAYPLNAGLIGSGSRTNAWGLDPHLPESLQPVLYHGFKGGYQRGHQLPSADRYKKGENERTFYGTNMTPQRGSLNEGLWGALEGRIRDFSRRLDTLYVVTGCVVDGSHSTARDNAGKSVTVPKAYFKALLGYSKTGTASRVTAMSGGYTGVGYYVEHNDGSLQRMTLTDLEQKVGMDFFVNLPSMIGAGLAARVESSYDDFWVKN